MKNLHWMCRVHRLHSFIDLQDNSFSGKLCQRNIGEEDRRRIDFGFAGEEISKISDVSSMRRLTVGPEEFFAKDLHRKSIGN